jgi:hypothetical protein
VFTPKSRLVKTNTAVIAGFLQEGEQALAMLPIGFNNKILTTRRLLFLDTSDSKIKEFVPLEKVERFIFGTTAGVPRIDIKMRDGFVIKIGTIEADRIQELESIFQDSLGAAEPRPTEIQQRQTPIALENEAGIQSKSAGSPFRTNSQKHFPAWLQKSIEGHKRADEELLMVITEPYTNHQGALLVLLDRCLIVKGGFWGGLMSGSLGGERAATFYFTQITGIEYNSGMLNGVLEILTPSYQGSSNKDFWKGSNRSRNADSNDPWTLSNTLPLSKDGYKSARTMIEDLRSMISESQKTSVTVVQNSESSISDEIAKLLQLRDQGVLSGPEFDAAKRKLLGI